MHVGFLTDGLGHLSRDRALDVVQDCGISEIELATGNWSTAPHLDLDALLDSKERRDALTRDLDQRGMRLGALNASGNSLHPVSGPEHHRVIRGTLRLAELLQVNTVVMMSGLPAAQDGDRTAAWITTSWPPENETNLERQWQRAEKYWCDLVPVAQEHGVTRIAVEMHADQLVYNVPTLQRLRDVAGSAVGANLDPSHLMWMGADPFASVQALAGAIYHVHAKDTRIEPSHLIRTRLEVLSAQHREQRAWNYATLGEGHPDGARFWAQFCLALCDAGYDGVLSIEHEDVAHTPEQGLRMSVDLLRSAIPTGKEAGRS